MAAAITRSSCSPTAACGLRFSSYTKVIISPSVHADTTSPGRMLGLAPGRSGACVRDWLNEQSPTFRDAIEVVERLRREP